MPTQADWRRFIRLTAGQPAWPRLVRAAALFDEPGEALDVGAGAGRDTEHLLREGWRVTAVDASPAATAALRRMPRQRNLQVVQVAVEDFAPTRYDLINAQFSLPFIPSRRFGPAVRRLRDAVRPGGVMAATFFGVNDEWNVARSGMTFLTEEDVRRLFAGWQVVELTEEDQDGRTADGTAKHWHVFHLIARKPGA